VAAPVNVLSTREHDRLSKSFDSTRCRPVDPLRKSTTTWDYIEKGGEDRYDNLEMVHLYCHQQIHGSKPEIITDTAYEPTRAWLRKWFA